MSKVDGSNIKFFQLRAVVAVVECGSFGKAAAKLEMTQSAISPAIAGLEDKLGVTLFARGRQGATLTPVGEAIFGNVHRILHELEAIARVTQDARGLEVGQVRVAAIRSLATHWLPQVISAFKQRYPKIQVTVMRCVNHGEVRAMLAGGLADVGLMDLGDTQGLTVQPISADDDVARLPPGRQHLPPTLTWQDLQPYALILPVPQDNSYIKLRAYFGSLVDRSAHCLRSQRRFGHCQHGGRGLGDDDAALSGCDSDSAPGAGAIAAPAAFSTTGCGHPRRRAPSPSGVCLSRNRGTDEDRCAALSLQLAPWRNAIPLGPHWKGVRSGGNCLRSDDAIAGRGE